MEKKKPKVEYSSRTNSFLVYTKMYTFKVNKEKGSLTSRCVDIYCYVNQ